MSERAVTFRRRKSSKWCNVAIRRTCCGSRWGTATPCPPRLYLMVYIVCHCWIPIYLAIPENLLSSKGGGGAPVVFVFCRFLNNLFKIFLKPGGSSIIKIIRRCMHVQCFFHYIHCNASAGLIIPLRTYSNHECTADLLSTACRHQCIYMYLCRGWGCSPTLGRLIRLYCNIIIVVDSIIDAGVII